MNDKILQAMKLLVEQPDLTVADVVEKCGYAGSAGLLYSFKKETGITPLKYRKEQWAKTGYKRKHKLSPETASKLEEVKRYLRETDLTLEEISDRVGWKSWRGLSARFGKLTGQSVSEYREKVWAEFGKPPKIEEKKIEDTRITAAKKFLRVTNWDIGKIAVRCGYSYAQSFYQFFKEQTGLSPTEYRAQEYKRLGKSMVPPRMQKAQRLLETTNNSIEEIGKKCGYSGSPSSGAILCQVFMRNFRPPPQEYRMRHHLPAIQTDLVQTDTEIDDIGIKYGFGGNWFIREFKKVSGQSPEEYRRKFMTLAIVEGVIQSRQAAAECLSLKH